MSDLVGHPEDRFSRVAAHLALDLEDRFSHDTSKNYE